jgi:hypothetical protein
MEASFIGPQIEALVWGARGRLGWFAFAAGKNPDPIEPAQN